MLIIFDVDGTLIDSIDDIKLSADTALLKYGFHGKPKDFYMNLMGESFESFFKKVLPENIEQKDLNAVMSEFKEIHGKSVPYTGISEVVSEMKKRGHIIAVLSNKLQNAAEEYANRFFEGKFSLIAGNSDKYGPKPNPDGIYYIMDKLDFTNKKDVVYIGDTATDALTAKNADVGFAAALWGYGNKKEMENCSAILHADSPSDLLKIIN